MFDFTKTIINGVKVWCKSEIDRMRTALEPLIAKAQKTADGAAKSVKTLTSNVQTEMDMLHQTVEVVQSTANTAKNTAESARSTANTAKNTAESAQSTANTAKNTAESAQSTANTAKTGLDAKADKADPVFTGSFSQNRKANTTIGSYSHAEGGNTTASGACSHAEGYDTTASGFYAHTEGFGTNASGQYSHAEGYYTTANADSAHAEGDNTTASGDSSHTEGYDTTASGDSSHAEGIGTTASGVSSHAEGDNTTAQRKSQHVEGEYNILDTQGDSNNRGKYAHIVGNGISSSARSNAHTLDWDGNAWYAGEVYVGGTGQDDESAVRLAKITEVGGSLPSVTTSDAGKVLQVSEAGLWEAAESAVLTGLTPATADTLGGIKVGNGLKITEGGTLSVDTASAIEADNTKPITSAAVYAEIGNINALLTTI